MHPNNGCLPCKLRKKKCDETKPKCRACERNVLICTWPTKPKAAINKAGIPSSALSVFAIEKKKRRKATDSNSAVAVLGRQLSSQSIPISVVPGPPMSSQSKYLLDHYAHRTGKLASAHVGSFMPFTETLLPMVHSSNIILESILTFSSFHLPPSNSAAGAVDAFEHQALALRSLKFGITQYASGNREVGPQLFLSMVMLCCVELASNAPVGSFPHHINALRRLAPSIVQDSGTPEAYKSAMKFGMELYAYFLALSCGCIPDNAPDTAIIQDTAFTFSKVAEHGHTGAMFGCAMDLFRLVPEVVAISRRARAIHQRHVNDSPDSAGALASRIATLLTIVSLWEPPEQIDAAFDISGRIFKVSVSALLIEADCRCADIADYDSPSHHFQETLNAQMDSLVAEFVALLSKLPPQSSIATTMCWSIAVMGSYAMHWRHRDIIRNFLTSMEATFSFKNMTRTRLLLESIWSKYSSAEREYPIEIAEAMRENGQQFLLG